MARFRVAVGVGGFIVVAALVCVAGCDGNGNEQASAEGAAKPPVTKAKATGPQAPADGPVTDAPQKAAPAKAEGEAAEPVPPATQGPSPQERALPAPKPGMVWVWGTVNNLAGRARVARTEKDMAEICVYQHDELPCVETTPEGEFSIQVPAASQVALLFRGDYLTPTLRAFVTRDEFVMLGNSRVPDEKGLAAVAKAQGKRLQRRRGSVLFGGVTGVNAKLEPRSGERFFLGFKNELLPDAKAIQAYGSGGFYNVKPGVVRMRFSSAGAPCVYRPENGFSGWPDPADPGVARVPIAAGHVTHLVTMACPAPAAKE